MKLENIIQKGYFMKKFKKVIATTLSALMVTSSIACGSANAFSTNQGSNVENKTTQTLVYPKQSDKKNKDYVEGEAVVMMKGDNLVSSGASLNKIMDVSSSIKVENVSDFKERKSSVSVVTVSSKKLSTKKIIDELKDEEDVLIAEPNYIYRASSITNDTYSNFQWSLENKGINNGKVGEDIKPTEMWNKKSTEKDTPVVAIIDSGVDYTHPDLKDKMWVNPYQNKLKGVHGFDFTGTIDDGEPMDDAGHGTHCAGIIGATRNNNEGVSGVADNVKIMALKFLNSSGMGTTEDAVSAYNYIYNAMKLGVNVVAINNSWGSNENSKILLNIINKVGKAGAVSVCATGNDGTDFDAEEEYTGENDGDDDDGEMIFKKDIFDDDDEEESPYTYPACYDSKYIISVAATGEDGKIASYSNYGKNSVDIAAPGSDILSTVSYNSFLPTIYSQEEINEKCQKYITKDFKANVVDLSSNQSGESATISETNTGYDDGLGDKNCLQADFTVDKGGTYAIEIPYTLNSKSTNSIHTSLMFNIAKAPAYTEDSDLFMSQGICFGDFGINEKYTVDDVMSKNLAYAFEMSSKDWVHIDTTNLAPKNETGERKLVVLLVVESSGEYTIKLDNIGLSKGTDNEEESFGKYDIYSGTSMATPCVTGSIALIKDKYSDLTTEQLIKKATDTVNQNSLVDEKTKSNGVLSLDKYGSVIPKVDSWTSSGNKTIAKGLGFENINKITVNDKEIKNYTATKNQITINDNSYFGGECKLKIYSKDGYGCYSNIFLKGTRYSDNGLMDSETIYSYDLISDGKYLYNTDDNNNIVRYSVNKKGVLGINKTISFKNVLDNRYKDITNGSSSLVSTSSPVYYNGKIYMVADYYLTPEQSRKFYMKECALLTYDVNTCKYTVKDIEGIGLTDQTLAFYNKEMYLIGGYDYQLGSLSTDVYKYTNSKWQKVSSLPSKRAKGKCLQYGDKLVYTLGINEDNTCPKNLIFDGSKWTESNKNLDLNKSTSYEIDSKIINYYSCGVDFVENGILYTGELFDNKGDTVLYNPSNDTFTVMNNYFHIDSVNGIRGAVVGSKYYGKGYIERKAHTFSFNVKTGMKNVAVTSKYGKVTGGGYYMPNTVATISATPNKNYKVKSIVINGKTYKKTKVQFTVTKDTKVTVNYIAYVTKVKLNRTSLKLNKGKSYQLKATVTPTNATNKKLTWSSNRKSVATVNSKGKVTANKKGSCIIKATAKDGSKKSATCKVTVK